MSLKEELLKPGERIIFSCVKSWHTTLIFCLAWFFLFLFIALIVLFGKNEPFLKPLLSCFSLFLLVCIGLAIREYIRSELILTDRRILLRQGSFAIKTHSISLQSIEALVPYGTEEYFYKIVLSNSDKTFLIRNFFSYKSCLQFSEHFNRLKTKQSLSISEGQRIDKTSDIDHFQKSVAEFDKSIMNRAESNTSGSSYKCQKAYLKFAGYLFFMIFFCILIAYILAKDGLVGPIAISIVFILWFLYYGYSFFRSEISLTPHMVLIRDPLIHKRNSEMAISMVRTILYSSGELHIILNNGKQIQTGGYFTFTKKSYLEFISCFNQLRSAEIRKPAKK